MKSLPLPCTRVLLALTVALGACQGTDDADSPPIGARTTSSSPVADAGARGELLGETTDGAVAPSGTTSYPLLRDADPGCIATTTAPPRELSALTGLLLTDLAAVGSRRVARDVLGRGLVLFDADGAGSSSAPIAVGTETRAAASETGVTAAGFGPSSSVLVQRFDGAGTSVGTALDLGTAVMARPVGVGRSGDTSLIVWAGGDDSLRARVIGASGAAATEVVLEHGAPFGDLTIAVVPSYANDRSEFLVVWALYRIALGAHRVYAARVNHEGMVGLPRVVLGSDVTVRAVSAVAAADGTTVLLNRDGEPMVVPLDVLGRPTGSAHVLLGAREPGLGGGHGLARNGGELALVAGHASGAVALRRITRDGAPLGGWICLETPQPDELQLGGITADGPGFAVVIAGTGGKTSLVRVDVTGRSALP